MNSPGKNSGEGSHSLLQGIFLTQEQTRSPVLQADSSLSESPGKPLPHNICFKLNGLLFKYIDLKIIILRLPWWSSG